MWLEPVNSPIQRDLGFTSSISIVVNWAIGITRPVTDNFHSSFAGALIRESVCREAICNRWSVSQERALDIAEKFYWFKPRTVYGRAVALLGRSPQGCWLHPA